jgi:O-antigen/teichoic acid export membrane protein
MVINSEKLFRGRLNSLFRSVGLWHGLIMSAAMILAGGLDYVVNVFAGRWLVPIEYGVFVSVAAILQIVLYFSIGIRNVVAFYTAELSGQNDASNRVGGFVQRAWRWAWRWGLLTTALMAIVSPPLAHLLQVSSPWPLWAACLATFLLFLRPITDGALQGLQFFGGLGVVQVTQAGLRLAFAAAFIWLGFQSTGAIVALPLGSTVALIIALWYLRPYFRERTGAHRPISLHYSAHTMLGLAAFGLLTNLDALFVKRFFNPHVAGDYGVVVTLAKISLFLPVAMGMVLFPKATQRLASGRDSRPILMLALAASVLPGLLLSVAYFMFPGLLVKTIFSNAYGDPGIVLGLANLAASLYAGVNIWLNFALSQERPAFIYAEIGVLVWQGLGMLVFGRESLVHMTIVMVSAGVIGNAIGFVTTWFAVPKPRTAAALAAQ